MKKEITFTLLHTYNLRLKIKLNKKKMRAFIFILVSLVILVQAMNRNNKINDDDEDNIENLNHDDLDPKYQIHIDDYDYSTIDKEVHASNHASWFVNSQNFNFIVPVSLIVLKTLMRYI